MRDNAGKHFGYDWNVNINFDGMTEKKYGLWVQTKMKNL